MITVVISDSPEARRFEYGCVYDLRGKDIKNQLIRILLRHANITDAVKPVLPSLPEDVLWVMLVQECRDNIAVIVNSKQAKNIPLAALNRMRVIVK